MAAINKLRAKGRVLAKVDPNSIKRKRSSLDIPEISERAEKNIPLSQGMESVETFYKDSQTCTGIKSLGSSPVFQPAGVKLNGLA